MDYAGVTAYGDFELSYSSGAYQTSEQRRYLDGECHETTGGSPAQTYWHGDLIASTFATSDSGGSLGDTMAYTAFGERINLGAGRPPASFPRYEYAGGYGYESGHIMIVGANSNIATITLQHLGARWCDPALGRFVQRDPQGVAGGVNVYSYCSGNPVSALDPYGHDRWIIPAPGGPFGRWPHNIVIIGPVGGKYKWFDLNPQHPKRVRDKGRIRYGDYPGVPPTDNGYHRSTDAGSDKKAYDHFKDMADNPPDYRFFFYNCIDFGWDVMNWDPPIDFPNGPPVEIPPICLRPSADSALVAAAISIDVRPETKP